MKTTILIRAILAGAALMAGVAAGAQGPGFGGPGGPGFGPHRPPMEQSFGPFSEHGRFWNDPAIVSKLNLTDDQRKGFDQILQQHRTTLVDLHANLEKAEITLEPLIRSDQPDEARILSQIDAVAQARAELEKANARYLLAIRAKLTPEQWKTLQTARAERFRGKGPQAAGGPGQGRPHNFARRAPGGPQVVPDGQPAPQPPPQQ